MTGKELQRLRKARELTQAELAAELGVHWSTVARWEQGVRMIPEPVTRLVKLLSPSTKRKRGR